MYIVLILLIFLAIISRLTSDTTIDCKKFESPIPIGVLTGCMGYRFFMVLNIILFVGFSTDFMDSLQKISLDIDSLICPWKVDETGKQALMSEQIYTSREGECLKPEEYSNKPPIPLCNTSEQILECRPEKELPLPGCFIKRTDYNNYVYKLKDVSDFNINKNDGIDHKIIVSKIPGSNDYKIDDRYNKININDSTCKSSIENWLNRQTDDSTFEPITKDVIDSIDNLTSEKKNTLLKSIGITSTN